MNEQATDLHDLMWDDLRELVWGGLVESDTQSRYYGYLAGKITRANQIASGLGCFFAVASATVVFLEGYPELAIALVLITGAISAISAVQGAQAQVAMAVYCQKRFDDLHLEWKALWHEFAWREMTMSEAYPSEAVVARWVELSRQGNDVTALSPVNTVNKKLHKRSQDESHNYFKTLYPQVTATDDRQALSQA